MGSAIALLLVLHLMAAVGVSLRTVQGKRLRWAVIGLAAGLFSVGLWSVVYRPDWGFIQKTQGLVISGLMEAGVLYVCLAILPGA